MSQISAQGAVEHLLFFILRSSHRTGQFTFEDEVPLQIGHIGFPIPNDHAGQNLRFHPELSNSLAPDLPGSQEFKQCFELVQIALVRCPAQQQHIVRHAAEH